MNRNLTLCAGALAVMVGLSACESVDEDHDHVRSTTTTTTEETTVQPLHGAATTRTTVTESH